MLKLRLFLFHSPPVRYIFVLIPVTVGKNVLLSYYDNNCVCVRVPCRSENALRIMFLAGWRKRLDLKKLGNWSSSLGSCDCFRAHSKVSHESVLPTQAQVVICGTGVVANSLAYHLVENGWSDIVLIDQGKYVFLLKGLRHKIFCPLSFVSHESH